jgi:predicted transcriptional regulator
MAAKNRKVNKETSINDSYEDGLLDLWIQRESFNFKQWVRAFAAMVNESRAPIESISIEVNIPIYVIESVIHLDMLSDVSLDIISQVEYPVTTWFKLSSFDEEELSDITELCRSKAAPDILVFINGYTPKSNVQVNWSLITPEILIHVSKKAKDYKALTDKGADVIKSMANQLKRNGDLSYKQKGYLEGLLTELCEKGVVSSQSRDGDQEICNKILQALHINS